MTVQTPRFTLAEQFESPQRKAILAEQWEGADGITAGDPQKIIQLLPSIKNPVIVVGNDYMFEVEEWAIDANGGITAEKVTRGGRWSGAAWDGFATGNSLTPILSAPTAFSGSANLNLNFVGPAAAVNLEFFSDKNFNAYWLWRVTLRAVNSSFPLLP